MLLPVTGKANWYFTAYFVLAIFKPFLNIILFSLDKAHQKMGFVVLFMLFSVQGFIGDPYQTANGYSAIWLIVLYSMGVMAKQVRIFDRYSSKLLIVSFLGNSIFTWLFFLITDKKLFINYISPTILLNGIILVILFTRMKVGEIGKFISKNSRLAFGIYLFQLNPIIWSCLIKDAFVSVANSEIYIGIPQVFGYSFLIFVSGLMVEIIRDRLFRAMQVDKLAGKVNDVLVSIASRSTVVLGCTDNVDCKGK